jgi:hypothetical protein
MYFAMATSTLEARLKCVSINDENDPASERKPRTKSKVYLPNVLQSCFLMNRMLSPRIHNLRRMPLTA